MKELNLLYFLAIEDKNRTNNFFFQSTIYLIFITNVIKRAVRTAPEPEAIICWYGFIVNDAGSLAISEEKNRKML